MKKKMKYFVILLFTLCNCLISPNANSAENNDVDIPMYYYQPITEKQEFTLPSLIQGEYKKKKLAVQSKFTSPNCLLQERYEGKLYLRLSTGDRYEFGNTYPNITSFKVKLGVTIAKYLTGGTSAPISTLQDIEIFMGDRTQSNNSDYTMNVAELILSNDSKLFYMDVGNGDELVDNIAITGVVVQNIEIIGNGTSYNSLSSTSIPAELSKFYNSIKLEFYYDATIKVVPRNINDWSKSLIYVKYHQVAPNSQKYFYYYVAISPYKNLLQPVRLQWELFDECSLRKIPYYHVQLLKLENTDPSNTDRDRVKKAKIDWSKALNLYTANGQQYIDVRLTEGDGEYVWRVRPIGNYYPGDMANDRNYGAWNEVQLFDNVFRSIGYGIYSHHKDYDFDNNTSDPKFSISYFTEVDINNKTNWTNIKIITEDENKGTKILENITHYDDLMRPRQSQSIDNQSDVSLVSQLFYDHLGRNTVKTLLYPQKEDPNTYYMSKFGNNPEDYSGLYYKCNILTPNLNELLYSTPSLPDASYHGTEGNLNKYYDGDNTLGPNISSTDVVPSAGGYPFARTVFDEDGTGRVKAQGNVGEQFSVFDNSANDHTNRISYQAVSDEEIVPLFGDETPETSTIKKIVSTDANNTQSISYVNKEGQVIATAVNPEVPSATNLEKLQNEPANSDYEEYKTPREYVYKIDGYESYGKPYTYIAQKLIGLPKESNEVEIEYKLASIPIVLDNPCPNLLTPNERTLNLIVSSEVKFGKIDETPSYQINGEDAAAILYTTTTKDNLQQGTYEASRVLTINNVEELKNQLVTNIRNKVSTSTAFAKIQDELAWIKLRLDALSKNKDPNSSVIDANSINSFYEYLAARNWSPTDSRKIWTNRDNKFYYYSGPEAECYDIKISILDCDNIIAENEYEQYLFDQVNQKYYGFQIKDHNGSVIKYTSSIISTIARLFYKRDPNLSYLYSYRYDTYIDRNGRFNTLIENMKNDGYVPSKLSKAWRAAVAAYLDLGIVSDGAGGFVMNKEYDLLESFLDITGRQLIGPTTLKYTLNGYVIYAHKYFLYDPTRPVGNCNDMFFAGTTTLKPEYTANDLYDCVNNYKAPAEIKSNITTKFIPPTGDATLDELAGCIDALGNITLDCINKYIARLTNDCKATCDKRGFEERIIQYFIDKNMLVSGIDRAKPCHEQDPPNPQNPQDSVVISWAADDYPIILSGNNFRGIVKAEMLQVIVAAFHQNCYNDCEIPLAVLNQPPTAISNADAIKAAFAKNYLASTAANYWFAICVPKVCTWYYTGLSIMASANPDVNFQNGCVYSEVSDVFSHNWIFYWIPQKPTASYDDVYYDNHYAECNETSFEMIKQSLMEQRNAIFNNLVNSELALFDDKLKDIEKNPSNYFNETYTITVKDVGYKHFTLYYYDRAGNLIKTVPPKGVATACTLSIDADTRRNYHPDHTYVTTNKYNSLGQITATQAPEDRSETVNLYDSKNRLILSQNAKQQVDNKATYIKYDQKNRTVEVGEVQLSDVMSRDVPPVPMTSLAELQSWMEELGNENEPTTGRTEYTELVYSKGYSLFAESPYKTEIQNNITNKLSYSVRHNPRQAIPGGSPIINDPRTDAYSVYDIYSYDIFGNIEWVMKRIPNIEKWDNSSYNNDIYSKIRYEYAQISGNINLVAYNEDRPDQFYQKFEYDQNNRLTKVYTSRDKEIWEQDATYEFYLNGPLKNKVIGQDAITRNNYYYTPQGALKGINSDNVATNPGEDLLSNGAKLAQAPFGFSLGYYNGDFILSPASSLFTPSVGDGTSNSEALFNGIAKTNNSGYSDKINNLLNPSATNYAGESRTYDYDLLYRLKKDANRDPVTSGRFASDYTYDPNGNLLNVNRKHANGTDYADQITNTIFSTDNTLRQKIHTRTDANNIPSDANINYTYDASGKLITQLGTNTLNVEWTYDDKVRETASQITSAPAVCDWSSGSSGNPLLTMYNLYDAAGNKVMVYNKLSDNRDNAVVSGSELVHNIPYGCDDCSKVFNVGSTYYVYDMSNMNVAIYKSNCPDKGIDAGIIVDRWIIYGLDGRIGSQLPPYTDLDKRRLFYNNDKPDATSQPFKRLLDCKEYELTDHLGNLRVLISDVKIPDNITDPRNTVAYNADILNVSNYYPYGKPIDALSYSKQLPYLFGYNGMMKDNHVAGEGNAYYTLFREYDPDLGRWWRPDPIFQPWQSPYSAFNGNPIMFTDVWGLEAEAEESPRKGSWENQYEAHGEAVVTADRLPPSSSEPTFGPSGGGIGFYEAENYAGRLPATTHSLSTEVFTAGDFSIGAQRNANGIQYFTAGRQVGNEFRIEYVIEANQLKTFLRDIKNYAGIANITYSKGYLTDADKEILAGNMFTGILKMWGEALTSPEWWVYATSSFMSMFRAGAVKGSSEIVLPPNDGFVNARKMTLFPGTIVDRIGFEGGYYVAPLGTSISARSLLPGTINKPYNCYEIIKSVEVMGGEVAPWFGQPGGGIQYKFSNTIEELIKQGIIKRR